MTSIPLQRLLTTLTLVALGQIGTVTGAHGQTPPAPPASPSTPLRIVIPFPAGTPLDATARELGNRLGPVLGRPVIVESKTGAGGNIGTEYVAASAPDGSTVLFTANNTISINPLIYGKLRFNPQTDLVPVASVANGGYLLAVGPKSSFRTTAQLIAGAKQKPDAITYASYGHGSMSHVCMEQFQAMTGTRMRHIPYRGPMTPDLMSGVVDVAFETMASTIPLVKDNRLIALGVTAARVSQLPQVPTVSETVPGFECLSWVGIFAPKGTPAAVQQRLAEEITKIVRSPSFTGMTDIMGAVPAPMDQNEFAAFVKADAEKWRKLIPPLNIKLD